MADLLERERLEGISEWTKNEQPLPLSIEDWATLLAMVVIDTEESESALLSRPTSQFVSFAKVYRWHQPFRTQTHREGTDGEQYLREYIGRVSENDQMDFNEGFNLLVDFCSNQIRKGNTQFEWLLSKLIQFTWARSSWFRWDAEIVAKVMANPKVTRQQKTSLQKAVDQ